MQTVCGASGCADSAHIYERSGDIDCGAETPSRFPRSKTKTHLESGTEGGSETDGTREARAWT
eukprot:3549960-Rhodomonas_salina.2